ncbi:MAG: hydantoinase/oxoprolinase family protein [Gammaproteobacteria bacterium]
MQQIEKVGIDTGGTFTDFVYFDGNQLYTHKVLSTHAAPEQAILQGVRELGLSFDGLRVIHGSTVATNAVLEGKGAKTVYISNRGLKDILTIGRQARRELYNLQPLSVPPPVPDKFLLETGGRLSAQGEVLEELSEEELERLVTQVRALQPESVAINLLFSFIDDRFEKKIAAALPDNLFVTRSSQVLCEQREYERGMTTWLNAYVGPLVQGYLRRLGNELRPSSLSVMRSSGDTCAGEHAGQDAVHLILSGPAGGLAGARFVAATTGARRIITFDMGGTSTDVALIDGAIELISTGRIGHYPIAVPMVDMHSIGAGGGSIAYVDRGGGLQVGPESAAAQPGPVCYGRGGESPTVTDANLVLGRLPRSAQLGGSLSLDFTAAYRSLSDLAGQLGLASAEAAAAGIIRVANEHMVQALRVISVQRGIDPRAFTLVAFGGAGAMHVCELADALGIQKVLAPIQAGVLSALGMLVAPAGRQLSRTLACLLNECNATAVNTVLSGLGRHGRDTLGKEGVSLTDLLEAPSLDLCYRGQAFTLNIPWQGSISRAEMDFHEAHERHYGHRLNGPVELLNVRLGVRSRDAELPLPEMATERAVKTESGRLYGSKHAVGIFQRAQLPVGTVLTGPVIVCDTVATTYVAPGWQSRLDHYGNLRMKRIVTIPDNVHSGGVNSSLV